MGTHISRAVRAHDSSQSLRNLNFSKSDNNNSNHSNHSTSRKYRSSGELDMMKGGGGGDDDSGHSRHSTYSNSYASNINNNINNNNLTVHSSTTISSRGSPEKCIARNHSFGDIYRLKQGAKSRMPRNLSYGELCSKHRNHHDLHSVSKRFQQVLGRSESIREPREIREVTFKKDFQTHYSCDLSNPLSHGRYAYVTAALSYITRENVAVKIIRKDRLFDKKNGRRCAGENVRVEVLALKNLTNQPNVVRFVDVFEDEAFFYLVMELCKGGSLLERINKVKNMKEEQAGPLLKQMLDVTSVCHAQGIAHRDLKLENFVFFSENEDYPLKLVDFGSAAFFKQGKCRPLKGFHASFPSLFHAESAKLGTGKSRPFKEAAGTFNYMAPEVFDHTYGPIADVWSLGIVAYSMLCGRLPFNGNGGEDLKEKIQRDEVEFSHPVWDDVSESAKDLLKKMLEKNPDYRITIDEALSHSWFRERGSGDGSHRLVSRTYSNLY